MSTTGIRKTLSQVHHGTEVPTAQGVCMALHTPEEKWAHLDFDSLVVAFQTVGQKASRRVSRYEVS